MVLRMVCTTKDCQAGWGGGGGATTCCPIRGGLGLHPHGLQRDNIPSQTNQGPIHNFNKLHNYCTYSPTPRGLVLSRHRHLNGGARDLHDTKQEEQGVEEGGEFLWAEDEQRLLARVF